MNGTTLPNSGPAGGSCSNVFTGNATRVAAEMLLNAMKKSNGMYRTHAEMVAENIPLVYDGKWAAAACTACSAGTGRGNPFPVTCTRCSCLRSRSIWKPARPRL